MTTQEKSALACKAFATLRAEFALIGRRLYRSHSLCDGNVTYFVERGSQTSVFSHLCDVQAHYTALTVVVEEVNQAKPPESVQRRRFDEFVTS